MTLALAWGLAACVSPAPGTHTTPTPVTAAPETPAPPAPAQATPAPKADDSTVVIGQRKTLQSQVLGEQRTFLVYTPPGYDTSTTRYPVLYLIDGEGHFHHATGIVDYLATRGRMAHMIVVGIANTDRTRDLTPTNQQRLPTSGGADRFLDFIKDELMPQIDAQYRTAPYRVLVGHSFGGLLAVHTLLTRPSMFDSYVAIAPSLQWDNQLMVRNADAVFGKQAQLEKFLYITLGTEGKDITAGNNAFVELLKAKAPPGLAWKFTLMEKEDHVSLPHRSMYDGLELLFNDWRAPRTIATVAGLKAHYERLTSKYRFQIQIPENRLNTFGYAQMLGKPPNMAEAFAAFQLNVKLYPDSANVYDSLGEAYERSGDMAQAAKNYELAVAKGTAGPSPFLDVFKQNLARARKALDGK